MSQELTIALIAVIGPIAGGLVTTLVTTQLRRRKEWREGGEKAYEKAIAILKGRFDRANEEKELAAIEQQLRGVEDDYLPYLKRKAASVSRDVRSELAPAGAITPDMPALSPSDREALEQAAATIEAFDPPKTAEDRVLQGNAFYATGEFNTALEQYNHALDVQPDDPNTLNNRGAALEELKRYDEALVNYNRSLELRPDDPGTLNNRGSNLDDLQRYDEAIADFDRALELKPNDPGTLYNRASVYSSKRQLKDSLNDLKATISRDAEYRSRAREEARFGDLRKDPELGPEFERLVEEPED